MSPLLVAVLGQVLLGADLAGSRPNIVLVMTDDQGYGELGCNGNPIIQTPNVDRMYGQSARFTDFHVSPTCSPTRCSLMTGRHEFRSGVTHTILERERMSPKATTVAQVLQKAGYATGIFGKWHLGDEAEYQPNRRGFDEVFVHGAGGIGQTYPGSCGDAPDNSYFNPAILHNGKFEKTEGYCTDVFFGQALKWIDARRSAGKPFFVYLTPNAPHGPYVCPEKYVKLYENADLSKDAKSYYGMITNIDENMGRLLAKLKEWNLDEKTLVIFMTDNGHSVASVYNAGMRGNKGTPYQGGTRVPAIWRWTGHIRPGVDVGCLTAHYDILPTFAALAGAPLPAGVQLDGRSLLPLLADPKAEWANRFFVSHVGRWPHGQAAESKYRQCSIRDARFTLVNNEELYDLKNDPGEKTNVLDKFPADAARLRAAYDQWWGEVLPALENENATGPNVNPFKQLYWKQFGGGPTPELLQKMDPTRKTEKPAPAKRKPKKQ